MQIVFAKRGYDLLLIARRKDRLTELSKELHQKYGVAVDTLVADLTNVADLEKVSARLCTRYRSMVARGKKPTVVVAAIARELAGFIWAIGQEIRITMAAG